MLLVLRSASLLSSSSPRPTAGVVVCERPTTMCEPGGCLLHRAQPTD
nr:hypothetical protein [Variovorax boronicumulans]